MNKRLVAYFSATGKTAKVAKAIAKAAGADLYEIKPAVSYTDAGLNWMDKNSRNSLEMKRRDSRPEIADRLENMEQYDTVFVGFPIWWYVAPTIVNTFMEAYGFSGKTIVLFATSSGNGFGDAVKKLQPSVAADTKIVEGRVWNGKNSEKELARWVNDLKIKG